jgi:hypothetical protein
MADYSFSDNRPGVVTVTATRWLNATLARDAWPLMDERSGALVVPASRWLDVASARDSWAFRDWRIGGIAKKRQLPVNEIGG